MKMNKVDKTQQNIVPLLKDGLPRQAFAIVEDPDCPSTWHLPHHTAQIKRAVFGKRGYEHTVDPMLLGKAVVLLWRWGIDGKGLVSDPWLIIEGARHLAAHFRKAGRPIPEAIFVLI